MDNNIVVLKTKTKHGNGARGPWTLYSYDLQYEDGEVERNVGGGFESIGLQEGTIFNAEVFENDKGYPTINTDTVEIVSQPAAEQQQQSTGRTRRSRRTPQASNQPVQTAAGVEKKETNRVRKPNKNPKDKYWEDKDAYDKEVKEPRITWAHAEKMASEFVWNAFDRELFELKVEGDKGRKKAANKAEQLDILLELIEQYSNHFYFLNRGITAAHSQEEVPVVDAEELEEPGQEEENYD